MRSTRKVKCADCKDVFRIEYDSRKGSQDTYTCKCGKLQCYPNSYGSFFYNKGGKDEPLSYEKEDHTIHYYEEDYIELSDEAHRLISEIRELGEYISDTMAGVYFYDYTCDEEVSLQLDGGSDLETVSINAKIRLRDDNGWKWHRKQQEERVSESLSRFKNVLIKIKSGELCLNKPQKVWDNDSLEWYDGARVQQNLFDYELYC